MKNVKSVILLPSRIKQHRTKVKMNNNINNIGNSGTMMNNPIQHQHDMMMKMMMTQMEQCNLLTTENQRLTQQNFVLQRETFELRDELEKLRTQLTQLNASTRRAEVEVKSTQTGNSFSTIAPFSSYITSGAQASSTVRISIHSAIERHKLSLRHGQSKSEKAKSSRLRKTAAREILWELGYGNDSITNEDIKLVRKRISSVLSNHAYDSKPEVIEKKKNRRALKKTTRLLDSLTPRLENSTPSTSALSLDLSTPQANSSTIDGSSTTLSSVSSDSSDSSQEIVSHADSDDESDGDYEFGDFDPSAPNDPSSMEIGMIVAIASNDTENDIEFAMLLEKPLCKSSEWSAKIQYMEQLANGNLGKTMGQPVVRSMKHVIMTDITVDIDGKISDNDLLRRRFNRYYDEWFAQN